MNRLPFLDGEQLMDDLFALGQIGRNEEGGIDRIAYGQTDLEGREWAEQCMVKAGLTVRRDSAGNTIGRYEGTENLPAILIGSHTDTVPSGGIYDGALGVLAGIACIRALHNSGQRLRHPVEIINFMAEEATMPGGTLGSLALVKTPDAALFEHPAWDGQPAREHISRAGIDLSRLHEALRKPESVAAFIELHVEQGETLELSQTSIGVVQGIVGIRRYAVSFFGHANHAGTTQMARRQDALVAAAPFILHVRDVAVEHDIVGTIGKVDVLPGASNVIPGRVDLSLEIRGLDEQVLDQAESALGLYAKSAGATFERISAKNAVQSDPKLLTALIEACQELEISYMEMPSGAGHDAMNMESLCPMAMLFVPSRDGISHAPGEYTAPEECIRGAQVLLAGLVRIDEMI
ncbi:MAG: Zn-dependent hydrolase [Chloroflexota bacterium]